MKVRVARPQSRTTEARRARRDIKAFSVISVSPWLVIPVAIALGVFVHAQAQLDPALLGKPPVDAWPTHHGDYSGRHYSTLNQINQSNVNAPSSVTSSPFELALGGDVSVP